MESKRVEVNKCSACPMRRRDAVSEFCGAHMGSLGGSQPIPPDWCPLRTGDVLVTLKKAGE